MPEGPSIVILKEAVQFFKGKKIINVTGNSKLNIDRLTGKVIIDFKSWGKHFLICFEDFAVRIHFMLFGSYRINEVKNSRPRLNLQFENSELNFYGCSVRFIEEDLNDVYDWTADVLNEQWNPANARKKIKAFPDRLVCDVLLDQYVFAGIGNIIKNEVLFRIKVHPQSKTGKLPPKQLKALLDEAVNYSFDFLRWKKAFELKKHWLVYTKKICPRCNTPIIRENLGKTNRRTFYCSNCQVLYA
jgi:endonuclease-8